MAADIKIMGDRYPFNVALKIGGAKETTENMNISSEGVLSIEATGGFKTLIASASS